jgi:hypothetical protein
MGATPFLTPMFRANETGGRGPLAPPIFDPYCSKTFKGTFLSESTDVFVITPNRRTFFFPKIFGDF